jgi:hypothetical protein
VKEAHHTERAAALSRDGGLLIETKLSAAPIALASGEGNFPIVLAAQLLPSTSSANADEVP